MVVGISGAGEAAQVRSIQLCCNAAARRVQFVLMGVDCQTQVEITRLVRRQIRISVRCLLDMLA